MPRQGSTNFRIETLTAADPHGETIGRRSIRGGMVMFAAQGGKMALQFGSVIVLARLLPPGAFGLIAMVAALSGLLDLLRELGLSTATIQRPHLTQDQISALFWINAAAGCLVAVALFLAAPLVALFFHEPALVAVTRWLCLGYVMSGLTTQHWALLRRQMRFGTVAAIDTSSDVGGLVAAVAIAILGGGYWALLAQRLVPIAINLAGSWIFCRWFPDRPRRADVRDLVMLGLHVSGSSALAVFARSIDQILIGWMWGAASLGLYERASKLLLVPLNAISIPLYSVALPALSRMTDDPVRFRRAIRAIFERLAMVTMPTAALVAVSGDWVTAILFGHRWADAAPIVAWFGAVGVVQPVINLAGLLYVPLNHGRALLRATTIDAALCLAFYGIGLHSGPAGVAMALAAGSFAIRLPISFWLATRGCPVTFRDLVSAIVPSALAAGAVALVGTALHGAFAGTTDASIIRGYLVMIPAALAAAVTVFALIPSSRSVMMSALRFPRLFLGHQTREV